MPRRKQTIRLCRWLVAAALLVPTTSADARPRYKQLLKKRYGDSLAKSLDACTTCHLPRDASADALPPGTIPPHNPFGARLRALGLELRAAGKPWDLISRLRAAADEDADGDGAPNELEILSGHAPGDSSDAPARAELEEAARRREALTRADPKMPWSPLLPVTRPAVPAARDAAWSQNPIDAFIARERDAHGLEPRTEAPGAVLLRRVYLDLTGLPPAADELRAFLADASPGAYERVVDRLLDSPRHGERWGRHWMDVWRYSDWAGWGNQVRDSQPHVWRWRDWIVESLNADKPYDRMALEMLAGDEVAPEDPATVRATGYLVRSFKLLSREAWMQEAVDHFAQAFLGVTAGCARCHDHMFDPISQVEYYRLRAVFEPYNVRIDRIPGQPDTAKDGLARAFDAAPDAKTYLFIRGDDRNPDKEHPLEPGVPDALGGPVFHAAPVPLPGSAWAPDKREFVLKETVEAGERAVADARAARASDLDLQAAEARQRALLAVLAIEKLEDAGAKEKDPAAWKAAAEETTRAQRAARLLDAERAVALAERAAADAKKLEPELKKAKAELEAAQKELAKAREEALKPPAVEYARRDVKLYPRESTGRRLALAKWLTDRSNPLAARVAVNHIWLRHFGQALIPSVNDFGQNGRAATHPMLLDWLAAELMEPTVTSGRGAPWSMKRIHRLIVTSKTYRMASTPDAAAIALDPDNAWYWRMPSRRLEAEAVRDGVLFASGQLDGALGGPELDQGSILSTRRRSIYYRNAAEKQPEFLKVFDGPGVSECYERKASVVPQQALALANSSLSREAARLLSTSIAGSCGGDARAFSSALFERVLARPATEAEVEAAAGFVHDQEKLLAAKKDKLPAGVDPGLRARENLAHALLNHNDFVTVR